MGASGFLSMFFCKWLFLSFSKVSKSRIKILSEGNSACMANAIHHIDFLWIPSLQMYRTSAREYLDPSALGSPARERPAGGALAPRRRGGPAGLPGTPGRGAGSARCPQGPAERGSEHVRAVKSHWYLWSVPADVPDSSVMVAEAGALAAVAADGTLLISNERCWQSSEECLEHPDRALAQCRGASLTIFVLFEIVPFFFFPDFP